MSRQDREQIFELLESKNAVRNETPVNCVNNFHYRLEILDGFDDIYEEYAHKVGKDDYIAPQQRDFWYENRQLRFKLSGGATDQLDFSKGEKSRKVFETFWELWNSNYTGEFDLNTIQAKFKEKFNEESPNIGSIVSNIRAAIINPKTFINERIIWKYNRRTQKWLFSILPLNH